MANKTETPTDDKPDWNDIEFVRKLVLHSMKTDESIESFDPDVFELINEHVKFSIFIENGNVFNKDELLAKYDFLKMLGKDPEDIFTRQQISYYEARNAKGEVLADACEHIVHDEGKETLSVKDQLYIMKNNKGKARKPTKLINTNIFLAREKWEHFLFLNRLKSSVYAFRDVKLLAQSPIGSSLLLEAPTAETKDPNPKTRSSDRESGESFHPKLNGENGVDIHLNSQSNMTDKAATQDSKNIPLSTPIMENSNKTLVEEQNTSSAVSFPNILGGQPIIDCLTFIIHPVKGQYDLYSEVNKMMTPKQNDAGVDIPFCADMTVPSFTTVDGVGTTIDLGVKCCLVDEKDSFHSYYIMPRSSINKTPLQLTNSIGLADAGYRGNLMAGLRNFSSKEYKRERGTALFQLVPRNEVPFKYVVVNEHSSYYSILAQKTERAEGGFGSTGARGNT